MIEISQIVLECLTPAEPIRVQSAIERNYRIVLVSIIGRPLSSETKYGEKA